MNEWAKVTALALTGGCIAALGFLRAFDRVNAWLSGRSN